MIKVVLFDHGGVLSPHGGSGSLAQSLNNAYYHLPIDEVVVDDLHKQLKIGAISEVDYLNELNHRYGHIRQLTMDDIFAVSGLDKRNQAVYELAAQLRQQGIATSIFSNIYASIAERLQKLGCYDGFEPLILSSTEHMAKPNQEFYKRAVEILGVPPNEIVLVDDQEQNLIPARTLGWQTVLAQSPDQIIQDVNQLV